MSNTTESPYSVTMRTGAGYEASLVTVRGDNAVELLNNIRALTAAGIDPILSTQSILQGAGVVSDVMSETRPAPDFAQQQYQQYAATAPVTATPLAREPQYHQQGPGGGGEVRMCSHGKRTKRSGQSAKGQWTAYFCALPKGSQGTCDPIWE